MSIERRGFLSRISFGMLAFAGAPLSISPAIAGAPRRERLEPWLDGLNGKHRQLFDVAANNQGAPLGRAANFLNVYAQAYSLKDADLNVVFCAHGTGLALVLGDALWLKYRLGTQYSINDPVTKAPATRNIFAGTSDAAGSYTPTVAALQGRGVRFVACMQSVARLSRDLAARDGLESQAINQDLIAGLVPGVTPVPAAIVAVNRAQEAGLTYVYIG